MRPLFLSVLLAVSLPAAAAPTSPFPFTHNDWTLACDNTRTCRAAGYQDDDGDNPPVSVLLTRKGGPGQPVSAELMLGQYDEVTLPKRLSLQINGKDLGALPLTDGTATLSTAQTTALLASLARSSRIVAVGNDGQRSTLSDRGASAVLLKMDEFQGRLETPGALVRKGSLAEASVPPALPVPTLVLAPRVAARTTDAALEQSPALRAALAAANTGGDCDALTPEGLPIVDGPQELHVTRLGKTTLLVSTLCWRGAYNEGIGYWVVNDAPPFKATPVTASGGDDDGRVISSANKGRGLGDCWSTASWGWDGRRFVQTDEATTGLCRLVAAGGAWQMPTLVTEVKP
ncbi:MAG: hypothetical protein GAK31_00545 [Stenotrophomonas maltophilia]|uniref:DUF1176 domain-containing protein n=1 Tax=Stenotrophomonas maltophilia TaxID=40324 RepID=A0A7V8FJJ0_STEMA|nr:MAG: hypothetical protein GAK31_00545 [Stenotrophomonas maltophilia]